MKLVWFRNDLRLDDHPALDLICRSAEPVLGIYIATPGQWRQHHEAAVKLGFRALSLDRLQQSLSRLGIPLHYLEVEDFNAIPQALETFCRQFHIQQIAFNEEYPLDEQRRDQAVKAALEASGIEVSVLPGDLVLHPAPLTKTGQSYRVFTAFYNAWVKQISALPAEATRPVPRPAIRNHPQLSVRRIIDLTYRWKSAFREDLWPPGEDEALARLERFCQRDLLRYRSDRDYPARPGTSNLSPYLALGLLGPRRCLQMVKDTCALRGEDWRENDWLRELAWRDFYRQLLVHYPGLSRGEPFRPETAQLRWLDNEDHFAAWCTGQTGFPLIDAGMRQLRQTGWMHNRLRMLTASFLSKLLLIDWHRGEQFFMEQLIDGDFAANNGGWQWCASTGCDAAPYFRIFNPERQSRHFDPKGDFIRRFVPELKGLDTDQIHAPSQAARDECGYPPPIIDYSACRLRAIEAFKALGQ